MSREMRFGEDAGNEIIKAVRETNRRMRNAEPYRGRWFNRSQPNAGTQAETCCCPKCNTDLPVTASCECLPDICVTVYDAEGVVLDELVGTWGSQRSFSGTITIGGCEIPIVITNGWGGDPSVPGFRFTSSSWECLGIPECGVFVAIECQDWKVGSAVEAEFTIDPSACTECEGLGLLTIKLRPKAMFRPKCDGCGCVDEYMCLVMPAGRASKAKRVDTEWEFYPQRPYNNGDPYDIAVKMEGRSAECSECVWKLSFPAAGVNYSDEEFWKSTEETACDYVEWVGLVAYAGTANEAEISYLRVGASSCLDCEPFDCFPKCISRWNGTGFTHSPLYVSVSYTGGTADQPMSFDEEAGYSASIDLGACGTLAISLYCNAGMALLLDWAHTRPPDDGCTDSGIGVALECEDGEVTYERSYSCLGCDVTFTIFSNNTP